MRYLSVFLTHIMIALPLYDFYIFIFYPICLPVSSHPPSSSPVIQQLPSTEDEGYHMLPQRDVNLLCDWQVRESVLSLPPTQGQFCFLDCGITRIQTPDDKANAFVYRCTTRELLYSPLLSSSSTWTHVYQICAELSSITLTTIRRLLYFSVRDTLVFQSRCRS